MAQLIGEQDIGHLQKLPQVNADHDSENESEELVCFLNVLERVATPYDNFLLCGANCVEDHLVMIEYGKLLRAEISSVENQTFTVKGQQVKFQVYLLPADMKWLSKFSGELNNAATYPNPFANVKISELKEVGHTVESEPHNKFKPWQFDTRMQVARKIEQFK